MTRDEFLAKLEASPSLLRNCLDNSVAYAYQIGALWAFDLLAAEVAEKDARIAELREAMEHFCKNYLLDERDDESLCYDDKHYKAIQRMLDALAKETT